MPVRSSYTIRERPPLGLNVLVQTPRGARQRWGWDDPNPRLAPKDLTFSTTMPGGFERCNLTLEREPQVKWADDPPVSKMTVFGAGGESAWQGRIEKLPDTAGYQSQEMIEAVGYQSALEDNQSVREIYVDPDMTKYGSMTAARRKQQQPEYDLEDPSFGTGAASGEETTLPSVLLTIPGGFERPKEVEAWYDTQGIQIGRFDWSWERLTTWMSTEALWFWNIFFSNTANAAGAEGPTTYEAVSSNLRSAGPETNTRQLSSLGRMYAALQFGASVALPDTEEATINGKKQKVTGLNFTIAFTKAVLFGAHGLTPQGTLSATTTRGLLASQIIAHALGKWAPGISSVIKPSTFVIPSAAFTDPTTVAEIIKQTSRYELLDWAVWEGPTAYVNPRGERGDRWRSRIGPSQLQQAGPQVSRLWNGVVVSYQDVSGSTLTVGPAGTGSTYETSLLKDSDPENPLNEADLVTPKYAMLRMGISTRAAALQVGIRFLEEQKVLEGSGQAVIVGDIEDANGIVRPAWEVRAGDQISFVDAAEPGYRRIVSTSYSDISRTNTIQLDQPPDGLQALLERLSVALVPFGVS